MQQIRFLVLFALTFLASSTMAGVYDPGIRWSVLQSDHFEIIYNESQKEIATNYIRYAEQAFATLQPVFQEMPSERTVVVIADVTDNTNGFATFLPYPQIVVYPVLPNSLDSITHYESWGFELLVHEYTHILTFLPSHSFYVPLKYTFGTVIRPTAILPRWYLEGLAVEIESRFTTHGRLRSPSTSAAIRALVADNLLAAENIDRVNESSIPTWPFGQRPYLLGSLLVHELTERQDLNLIYKLEQRYSRRLPFLLNAPLEEEIQTTYENLWNNLRASYASLARMQIEAIRRAGVEQLTEFTQPGESLYSPAVSPNGQHLVYAAFEAFKGSQIRMISRPAGDNKSFTGRPYETLQVGKGFQRLSWLADSSGFVFEKMGVVNRYYNFYDLHLYDLASKKATQLTMGQRAQEPAVSPDGRLIAYVQNDGASQQLNLLTLADKKTRTLVRAPFELRVSRPEFLDSQRLVFTGRSRQGQDRLYVYNINSGIRQPILGNFKNINMAKMTKRGLVFISSDSGAANLYIASADLQSARAVSNTTTEVANGDYDSLANEFISARMTGRGRRLYATSQPKYWEPASVKPINSQNFAGSSNHAMPTETAPVEKSYWPIKYMLPRYWIPFIYPVERGMLFQGSTANSDPVGRHNYQLDGSYDTVTEKLSYGVRYLNSMSPVDILTSYVESNELVASSSSTVTNRNLTLGGTFFLPRMNNYWRGGIAASQITTEIPNSSGTRPIQRRGPTASLNYSNLADAESFELSSNGYQMGVSHTSYLAGGDNLSYDRDTLSLAVHWRDHLPTRHRLVLGIKSAFAPKLAVGNVVALGDRTIGANYLVSLINSNYLLRGYPSGALVGRKIINANLEYRMPLADIFHGWGLFPFFMRGLETAVFLDGAAVDGAYYSPDRLGFVRSELDRNFYGAGADLTLTSTAAYHLPLTFTLGLYYGFDKDAGGGFAPFFGIGYVGHGGVD